MEMEVIICFLFYGFAPRSCIFILSYFLEETYHFRSVNNQIDLATRLAGSRDVFSRVACAQIDQHLYIFFGQAYFQTVRQNPS